MTRREAQESEFSIISSLAQNSPIAERLLNDLTPDAILHRALSISPVVSTTSSCITMQQEASQSDIQRQLRAIGAGTCGTVFERPLTLEVIKRAKLGYEEALFNDCVRHKEVLESFARRCSLVGLLHVPKLLAYIDEGETEFWTENGYLFPWVYQTPSALLLTERILPLPKAIRFALIDKYFPEQAKEEARTSEGNKDCLVRLYLGKRRDPHRMKPTRASLRNYNLHLDQMEDLALDTRAFAGTMARALAIMHWDACIDADDVEFVLGGAPTATAEMSLSASELIKLGRLKKLGQRVTTVPAISSLSFHRRSVTMWLLDFNRCRPIYVKVDPEDASPEDEGKSPAEKRTKGVQMAVDAFFRNDPYFPRPLSAKSDEQALWKFFRGIYLDTGEAILGKEEDEIRDLPKRFIDMVESKMEKRLARKAEAEKRLAAMGPRGWEEGSEQEFGR